MENIKIESKNAPAAIGPYSQAIKAGNTLYVSGNLPVDPITGNIKETIEEQATQVFENMKAVLNEAGYDFKDIVKTTCFLKNMSDFGSFNNIYSKYFSEPFPARSCVEVSKLPKDVLVEAECIAVK